MAAVAFLAVGQMLRPITNHGPLNVHFGHHCNACTSLISQDTDFVIREDGPGIAAVDNRKGRQGVLP